MLLSDDSQYLQILTTLLLLLVLLIIILTVSLLAPGPGILEK